MTHVICLAIVCLEAALSAVTSFPIHETQTRQEKSFLFLHDDSSYCTVAVYFYVYMYICKCINNNVIILLEPVFLVVVNDRAMLAQAQDGEPLLLGGLIAVYLSYY